jgi:hypothetical protein
VCEAEEFLLLEALGRERLVKTPGWKRLSRCCDDLGILEISDVVPSRAYKWSINPFTNPNFIYTHPQTRDNILLMSSQLCLGFPNFLFPLE